MRLRTFVRKFAEIQFGKKVRSFSPKSSEMFLNSSKFVLISFAQYCMVNISAENAYRHLNAADARLLIFNSMFELINYEYNIHIFI